MVRKKNTHTKNYQPIEEKLQVIAEGSPTLTTTSKQPRKNSNNTTKLSHKSKFKSHPRYSVEAQMARKLKNY